MSKSVTAAELQSQSLGSVEESRNEDLEDRDSEEIRFRDPRLRDEAKKTKTRPLSASSNGSIGGPNEDVQEDNPFVKAISSQRKDFKYVTNLRKEVIHIVEPFRQKVLLFDERLLSLEKNQAEIVEHIKDEE